jgi:hypothetical protein
MTDRAQLLSSALPSLLSFRNPNKRLILTDRAQPLLSALPSLLSFQTPKYRLVLTDRAQSLSSPLPSLLSFRTPKCRLVLTDRAQPLSSPLPSMLFFQTPQKRMILTDTGLLAPGNRIPYVLSFVLLWRTDSSGLTLVGVCTVAVDQVAKRQAMQVVPWAPCWGLWTMGMPTDAILGDQHVGCAGAWREALPSFLSVLVCILQVSSEHYAAV